MKHVIIGNSTAAVGAVEGIRRLDRSGTITMISAEPHHTYARPLISYFLAGKLNLERMAYRPYDFYQQNNVTTMLGQRANTINTAKKLVRIDSGEDVPYDQLLVATGSKQVNLPIEGMAKENVFSFYTLDDAQRLQAFIRTGMKGVVLGAGLTALKAAEALVALGVETTLVVRSRILRNFLDTRAAELMGHHLTKSGLRLVCGNEPVAILGKRGAQAVQLANDTTLPCDFVVSSVGIAANIDVVEQTAVEVDRGILVEHGMRTNVSGVYAAGDVAQGYDLQLGSRRVIPLLPVAYAQGDVAGQNMAGAAATYAGMGMNAVSFFGLPVISAGCIDAADGDDVHLEQNVGSNVYRKLIFRGEHLSGFVLMDKIDRAGILTWLIREKINVTPFKESLIDGTFNHAHLPEPLRREKVLQRECV